MKMLTTHEFKMAATVLSSSWLGARGVEAGTRGASIGSRWQFGFGVLLAPGCGAFACGKCRVARVFFNGGNIGKMFFMMSLFCVCLYSTA